MGNPKSWRFIDDMRYFLYEHEGIESLLKLITCPCCCLCYLDLANHGRKQRKKEHHMSRINQYRRVNSIRNRKRSLSVDGKRKKRKMKDQGQSPLFGKLPAEIRLKIYEMVLCETGRVHVHLKGKATDQSSLASSICVSSEWLCTKREGCKEKQSGKSATQRLSLLQTCRQVYREAIDILYAKNAFDFDSPWESMLFSVSILPHRLNRIKETSI